MDNLYNHHINRKNLNYSRVSNRTIKNYNPVPIMKLSEIRNYEVLSIRYTGLKFLQEQKGNFFIKYSGNHYLDDIMLGSRISLNQR